MLTGLGCYSHCPSVETGEKISSTADGKRLHYNNIKLSQSTINYTCLHVVVFDVCVFLHAAPFTTRSNLVVAAWSDSSLLMTV